MSSRANRAYYRLRYPDAERPRLQFDNSEYEVVELSELGGRIHLGGRELRSGTAISGWVRFRDGESAPIEGQVIRTEGKEAVLQLTEGVSFSRMLAEQRRLIRLYPMMFDDPSS